MKAAQFSRYGGPEVLEIVDLPDPHPGPGQVRIVVHAAGLSGTDPKLRSGKLSFGRELPQTTGSDVAGVVDEVGEGVTDVGVGDRVFGISDDNAGAAELALMTFRAPIPPFLGFVDAAALPVALETATRSLDELKVGPGTTLLISGAAGGIGSAAVQLAVARGARVNVVTLADFDGSKQYGVHFSEGGHVRGRLVLVIGPEPGGAVGN